MVISCSRFPNMDEPRWGLYYRNFLTANNALLVTNPRAFAHFKTSVA